MDFLGDWAQSNGFEQASFRLETGTESGPKRSNSGASKILAEKRRRICEGRVGGRPTDSPCARLRRETRAGWEQRPSAARDPSVSAVPNKSEAAFGYFGAIKSGSGVALGH